MHLFHKWTKWILFGNLKESGQRFADVYKRECTECGKVQHDTKYLY